MKKEMKSVSAQYDEMLKDVFEGQMYTPWLEKSPKKKSKHQDVVLLKKYMELEATLKEREDTIAWMSRLLNKKRGNQFTGG